MFLCLGILFRSWQQHLIQLIECLCYAVPTRPKPHANRCTIVCLLGEIVRENYDKSKSESELDPNDAIDEF